MWWDEVVDSSYKGSRRTMLIGEYTHTLDPKKRLSLPAKWRKELGKKVVLTRGLDTCLFIYPMKAWERISEKIAELPMGQADTRGFNRFFLSGAVEAEVDGAGRILVPDFLKGFAGLKRTVVLAGVHDRVEIWDEKSWNAYKARIERSADTLAEKLGEIGVL
jgi:MraZ protein